MKETTHVAFRGAKDPFGNVSIDKGEEGFTQTGTVTLPRQRFAHLKLNPPARFYIQGSVESRGPPFDFFTLRHSELEQYQLGNEFEYVTDLSVLGTTSGGFEAELPSDVYRLLFDNTVMGEVPPASEVAIDFEWYVRPA